MRWANCIGALDVKKLLSDTRTKISFNDQVTVLGYLRHFVFNSEPISQTHMDNPVGYMYDCDTCIATMLQSYPMTEQSWNLFKL